MSITLGNNIASLRAQRQLFNTDQRLSSVFERLSSGQRINRASDDAAGLSIAESLRTDTRVYNQAVRNLNDGLSVLNIADSTVSELSSVVIRIQELAEQAANGTISNTQRKSLDQEAQALSDEFFRISRVADFNGLRLFDGSIEDGVRLQAGYGTDGSIFSSLGGEMGDGTFGNALTSGVGNSPLDVQAGDLNGDGYVDLVTANQNSEDVSVLLGNGDGTFQSAQTVTAGNLTSNVALGDFDSDGTLDIASASQTDNDVTILLGNGDGSFDSPLTFAVGTNPSDIQIGDLNGDGVLDIVTVNGVGNDTSILLGNGDGTFKTNQSIDTGGSSPRGVDIGDLNGDGVLNLAVANASDTTSIFLGNGDGSFQSSLSFLSGDNYEIALGDLNQDGILDILVAGDDQVETLLGNGDGTFQAAQTLTSIDAPLDLVLGDVNGDDILDIVTANYFTNKSFVVLGRGDGTFNDPISYVASNDVRSVELADIDSDGVLDLAATGRTSDDVVVLFGNTREGIAPILDFSLQTQADALQSLAPLKRKLDSLSEQRGIIGAFQSRIETAISTLSSTSENYSGAESRIRDADIAYESSQLTRLNILQQAASAVLGQANQQPALALQLLGGR